MRRWAPLLAALAVLALAGPASAASGPKLTIAPKAPLTSSGALTVSVRADRTLTRRQRFVAALTIETPPPLLRCTGERMEARSVAGLRKGKVAKLVFAKNDHWMSGQWCPGKLKLTLEIVTADKVGTETARPVRGSLSVPVTVAPGTPGPSAAFTPATLTLLPGSVMTISAPGHADRSTELTGVLQARKPGRLIINRDYDFVIVGGTISAAAPAVDPLCTPDPEPWPGSFTPEPNTSTTIVRVNRSAAALFQVPLDAARLTGCKGTGGAAATTVSFTGTLDSKGLSRLQLRATVTGIVLADGTPATITFTTFTDVAILDDVGR